MSVSLPSPPSICNEYEQYQITLRGLRWLLLSNDISFSCSSCCRHECFPLCSPCIWYHRLSLYTVRSMKILASLEDLWYLGRICLDRLAPIVAHNAFGLRCRYTFGHCCTTYCRLKPAKYLILCRFMLKGYRILTVRTQVIPKYWI